jgi:hypothetical protein
MAIAMVLAVAVQGGDGAAVVPASVLVAVARTIYVSYHLRGRPCEARRVDQAGPG